LLRHTGRVLIFKVGIACDILPRIVLNLDLKATIACKQWAQTPSHRSVRTSMRTSMLRAHMMLSRVECLKGWRRYDMLVEDQEW
jgi:hypothetical protein